MKKPPSAALINLSKRIPFRFESHLSRATCHSSMKSNAELRIQRESHVYGQSRPAKHGYFVPSERKKPLSGYYRTHGPEEEWFPTLAELLAACPDVRRSAKALYPKPTETK